ncbi:MAG TPA: histidine kinase [Puia sp.]|nr:histidine kinase [Puia sp.]
MTEYNDTKTVVTASALPFLIRPKFRVYRHLLALISIGAMLYSNGDISRVFNASYVKSVLFVTLIFIFYTNMYWLVPKYLFRNKYPQYALGIAAYIGLIYLSGTILQNINHVKAPDNGLFFVFFIIVIHVAASTAIKLFQRWAIDTQRIIELEKATMQSELEQLKNQINPHFLLNMLNNANVLTQKDPEKASQVLIKLSDLLRYQLYDSARPKVLLTAEIHFVTDLLNLEKTRRDNFQFALSREGDISGVQVAPLLFAAFVENAVKHSLDAEGSSYINLHFDVQNDVLHFKCINSRPPVTIMKNDRGGLGLANVKRRLELLYPGRHTLTIDDKGASYAVTLTINLWTAPLQTTNLSIAFNRWRS